jgi:glycosyltransferase involved in cell wall biosynthesis
MQPSRRVVYFATQGSGHSDEERIAALLEAVGAERIQFNRGRKTLSFLSLLRALLSDRPDLVVMEGTGIAGGLAVIAARLLGGVPYAVSSGDAVSPFVALEHPRLAPLAAVYERLLCRLSAGFIGWSPYLVGRALTLGAPRGMTAAGWAPAAADVDRAAAREELGIPAEAIVFGLVGNLVWVDGIDYCYGRELVEAVLRTDRDDLRVLVVGDGEGLERLAAIAGDEFGRRILLPGRVPRESVSRYLAAIDVASLPQSVDGVGSFRYTTKISEYLAAGLPVVTGQIPLAYDLDDGWIWRLPGESPWDPHYLAALAELMQGVSRVDVEAKRAGLPAGLPLFDRERQRRQVAEFVRDLLENRSTASR